MAEAARAAPTSRQHRGLPEEIVVWEILVRLPARSVLRCRAVCRSFRCLTSTDGFLLAHHRHQPRLPLASRVRGGHDLLSFDHAAAQQLRLVAPFRHPGFQVRASCDGLLLLSLSQASFYVCNPATRQWALLPFIPNFLGFYPHQESGEYRLLFRGDRRHGDPNSDDQAVYYVHTVGSRNARRIWQPAAAATSKEESASVEEALAKGAVRTEPYHPSVLLHGHLNFYPVEHPSSGTDMAMVFSTAAESFRWMRAPAVPKSACLFEMDGKLAVSSTGDGGTTVLDIWVLQDYDGEVWECKFCVLLPLAWEGILTERRHFVAMFLDMIHVGVEGKVLANFRYHDQSMLVVPHRFKESLAQHAFFPTKQDGEVHASLSPFV